MTRFEALYSGGISTKGENPVIHLCDPRHSFTLSRENFEKKTHHCRWALNPAKLNAHLRAYGSMRLVKIAMTSPSRPVGKSWLHSLGSA